MCVSGVCPCVCVSWGFMLVHTCVEARLGCSSLSSILHLIPLDRVSSCCFAGRQQTLEILLPPYLHSAGVAGMCAKNKTHILMFAQEVFLNTESPLQLEYSIFASLGI